MRMFFADNSDPTSWASRLRRARMLRFLGLFPNNGAKVSILDVGGCEGFWANVWDQRLDRASVTLLNLNKEQTSGKLPIVPLVGDARDLSRFKDREFDFCFSNSVIEHVGTLADQRRMANEISRVAKGYFVQTPYRYFAIEPHFHFPAWALLPLWLRTTLHQRFNLGFVPAEKDYLTARIDVEAVRLLSLKEYRALFPDARIQTEKIGPLVKSLIAIREISQLGHPDDSCDRLDAGLTEPAPPDLVEAARQSS